MGKCMRYERATFKEVVSRSESMTSTLVSTLFLLGISKVQFKVLKQCKRCNNLSASQRKLIINLAQKDRNWFSVHWREMLYYTQYTQIDLKYLAK